MKAWSPETFERKVRKVAVEYMALRTSMKPAAINDFIVKNNLDAQRLVEDFDNKWYRHDLVTAIVGDSNNYYAVAIIADYRKK
jgi:hypothetical protein